MLKQSKTLIFMALVAMLALNACAPVFTASAGNSQEPNEPEVIVEEGGEDTGEGSDPITVEEGEPASVGNADPQGYFPVRVVDVIPTIDPATPTTVNVRVGYDQPDSCAQLEYINIEQDGAVFFVKLGSIPSKAEGCIQDTLPMVMNLPLNISDLPNGEYEVDVNGARGTFTVSGSESTGDLRTPAMPTYNQDVAVEDLSIRVGVGSPRPMHTVVTGKLPVGCGQAGEVQFKRDGNTFFVRVIAELPAQTECNPEGYAFQIDLPINMVSLPEGTYEVNVNGVTTSFTLPLQ